jgi:hypothetical protein
MPGMKKNGEKLNPSRPGFIRTPTDPTKKKGQMVAKPKPTTRPKPGPGVGPKPKPVKKRGK